MILRGNRLMPPKCATTYNASTYADVFRRTGVNARKNAEWLLRFIQSDTSKWGNAEWVRAIQDVEGFAHLASGIPAKDLAPFAISSDLSMMTASVNLKDGGPLRYIYPTTEHLKELRELTRETIEELLVNGKAIFPPMMITLQIERADRRTRGLRRGDGDLLYFMPPRGDSDEIIMAFRVRTAQVLVAVSELIRRCPILGRSADCRGLFLASRDDQTFCRKQCGSLYRMTKHRLDQKNIAAKRAKRGRIKLRKGGTRGTKARKR